MKVAILTLPLHLNYGGILQCYALQEVLTRMGHDVKVLSRPKYGRLYFYALFKSYISYLNCKYVKRKQISPEKIFYDLYQYRVVSRNLRVFVRENIVKYTKRNWNKVGLNFDAIVVGSDQVWRAAYHSKIEEYYLSFLEDKSLRRISYAASFGLDNLSEYSEEKLKLCVTLLRKFNKVSVREDSGKFLCKDFFGVNAELLIDPTLLLEYEDYKNIFEKSKLKVRTNILLAYFLDINEDKILMSKELAREKGLELLVINSKAYEPNSDIKERIRLGIEDWLFHFNRASFIITDSYHGCLFSVIFKKGFLALGNDNRGLTRFSSFFSKFSLERRLISKNMDFESILKVADENIDYNSVYDKLKREREKSYEFLYKSLK